VWLSSYFGNTVADEDFQQVLQAAASSHMDEVADSPAMARSEKIAAEKRFFHWEFEFPDVFFDRFGRPLKNPGFDAVVGNPPYVRQEQLSANKPYLKKTFETYSGVADLYVYFYEQSHRILRRDGRFGMITSNKFIRAAYGGALREYLAKNAHFTELIDFGDLPVFPEVSAYPCIVLTVKAARDGRRTRYLRVPSLEFDSLVQLVEKEAADLLADALEGKSWRLMSASEHQVLKKMELISVPLKAWLEGIEIRRGVLTGFNKAFFIDEATRARLIAEDPKSTELIKPLVIGEDIKRYEIEFKGRYLIWTYIGVPIEDYPAIYAHLKQHQSRLEKRWDKGEHWWELRHCDYYEDFARPKIIFGRFMDGPLFGFDGGERYFTNDAMYIAAVPDGYPVTVLNSRLGWHWLKHKCTDLRGKYIQVFIQDLEVFPIRRIFFTTPKDERARLVEEGKQLYQGFLKAKTPTPFLDLVKRCLPKDDEGNFIQEEEKSDVVHDLLAYLAKQMIELNKRKQKEIKGFLKWIEREWKVDIEDLALKTYLKEYHKHDFDEMIRIAKRNKKLINLDPESRKFQERLEQEGNASVGKLHPLKEKIQLTDNLINQIVYKLYGLTEGEIGIVEGRV